MQLFSRTGLSSCLLIGVFSLAGCAQMQSPGYYNPPKASTTQDAIESAEGARSRTVVQAPSQIQIKLRPTTPPEAVLATSTPAEGLTPAGQAAIAEQAQADTAQSRLIPVAETFQGTLPCFHRDMRCTAQRITLTLAPNGRWRARAAYLEQSSLSGTPQVDQGCWRALATSPPTILLFDANQNVRAELLMPAHNLLRVKSIDGDTPNLAYTLNRQPDIDPIAELDSRPAPVCP